MRATSTKIPHLLCEDLLIYIYMMEMGEKNRNTKTKPRKKIPRLVTLPSPRLQNGDRLFFGAENTANTPDLP